MSERSGPKPEAQVYAGVKWGLQNPSVILVGAYLPPPTDELTLVHEFYRQGVLLPEMVLSARDVKERLVAAEYRAIANALPVKPATQHIAVHSIPADEREAKPGWLDMVGRVWQNKPLVQFHAPRH